MSTNPMYYADTTEGTTLRGESETAIANFYPITKKVSKYRCGNKIQKKYVVEFYDPYYIGTVEIDSKGLEKFDYTSVDDSLQLNPTISTAGKEMAYYIRDQAKSVEVEEKILLDSLGWHLHDENHIYCAGNMIIGKTSQEDYVISEHLSGKYHLDVDKSLSKRDAVIHTMKLMNITPGISNIVFVFGLLGPLHGIILDAGTRPPCLPYLHGPSQTLKTSLVKACTLIYNRSSPKDNIDNKRVSSTEIKLEECIDEIRDGNFLLDDLFCTEDKKLKKIYEGRVEAVIRNFGDYSERETAHSSYRNNAQVIITAEYVIRSKTDVGRLFLIPVDKPINSEKLGECQKSPLALSTFYYYFISWLSSRYDEIVERLKNKYHAFRLSAQSHESKFGRLYEQFFLLDFAFSVYLEYVESVGMNINKDIVITNFRNHVSKALKKQNDILTSLDKREVKTINFSKELVNMISDGSVTLSKKGEECFEKGGFIYITTRYFNSKLREKYDRDFTAKSIAAYFRSRYISEVDSDNRQKKYQGKRYLKLDKTELMKDANDTRNEIDNLFY